MIIHRKRWLTFIWHPSQLSRSRGGDIKDAREINTPVDSERRDGVKRQLCGSKILPIGLAFSPTGSAADCACTVIRVAGLASFYGNV